jgi:transcriptional regulator with XRE-family HTH domain
MGSLIPRRIEGIASAAMADERTLRLCFTEQDAILASIQLSGLTYREIAARMGASKSLVNALAKGERGLTDRRTAAFCNATGTLLVRQWRELQRAIRVAQGIVRERDRIAVIASYSQAAA